MICHSVIGSYNLSQAEETFIAIYLILVLRTCHKCPHESDSDLPASCAPDGGVGVPYGAGVLLQRARVGRVVHSQKVPHREETLSLYTYD